VNLNGRWGISTALGFGRNFACFEKETEERKWGKPKGQFYVGIPAVFVVLSLFVLDTEMIFRLD
jgi:hypothetical protein